MIHTLLNMVEYGETGAEVLRIVSSDDWSSNNEETNNKSNINNKSIAADETLFRVASELICIIDSKKWTVEKANPAFLDVLGFTKPDVVERYFLDFVHPEDIEKTKRIFGRISAEVGEFSYIENRFRCRDASYRFIEWRIAAAAERNVVYAIGHDVTEHNRAERAAVEGEKQYRMLYQSAPVGIFTTDYDGRLLSANDAMATILGCGNPVDAVAKYTDLGSQFYLDPARRTEFLDRIRTRGSVNNFEVQGVTADNRTIWIDLSARMAHRESDDSFTMEGFATDITYRKLHEIERDRLMKAIEHAGESIIITDAEWNIVYANPSFEQTTGWSREEAREQSRSILKCETYNEELYRDMEKMLHERKTWYGHVVSRRKDGSRFTEDATISPVLDENREVVNFVLVKRDITDELAMEEQYRQAQKMESIGRLSGGVAHDFNNILTIVEGYMDLLGQVEEHSEAGNNAIVEVKKAIERASTLTQQLLAFSRKQVVERQTIRMAEFLDEMQGMLERLIKEDIDVIVRVPDGIGCIKADPGQMQQIMINLAANARDAMPGGGTLLIEADVFVSESTVGEKPERKPTAGEYVRLTVSDTGEGIDPKYVDKIFEPFFTLKGVGKGTGLGLSTVYGIINQSGGYIDVSSNPGEGTTFYLYFPRTGDGSAENAGGKSDVHESRRVRPEPGTSESEVVLVAEDEKILRDMIAGTLRNEGYTVLEAADGKEAIELARTKDHVMIDLLLTDVIMPKIRGMDVAKQIRRINSGLKVLYVSGYTAPEFRSLNISDDLVTFLQKPFSSAQLLEAIRELIDR